MSEQEIVRWVLLCDPARRLLFEALGGFAPEAFYKPEVVQPFFDPGKGDLDVLVCNRNRPQEAAAIEIKRVKVTVLDMENDRLNKLEDARVGVRQANRLYDTLGFFRSYLGILSVIDASRQDDFNIPCRGINSASKSNYGDVTTFKRIVEFPNREDLKPEIGIVFIELVQPSGLSINTRVTFRVCVHHPASSRTQSTTATNRVVLLLQQSLADCHSASS
jgi:hypothetical protein